MIGLSARRIGEGGSVLRSASRRVLAVAFTAVMMLTFEGCSSHSHAPRSQPATSIGTVKANGAALTAKLAPGWSQKSVWTDAVIWSSPADGKSGPADSNGVLLAGASSGIVEVV